MAEKHLHIVSFDVPYPVDYGGVFDVYYKIRALSEAGVRIHLHCYAYGRARQQHLEDICHEVHYYPRIGRWKALSTGIPYIVASRSNPELLARLREDDYPVLMEGMHCTYHLYTGDLPASRCFVRLPNVEHLYYERLAQTTSNLGRKWFYQRESRLLQQYEASLANKANFWTISDKDLTVFRDKLGYAQIDNLPLYLPDYEPAWKGERGGFCLYHGNLSVDENEYAATWLLEEIFSQLEIPVVVAGKDPSDRLEKLAHARQHTCLVSNPGDAELHELIRKAQVNILPSFNATGIKLKLIQSLYLGRHCLVNTSAVEGSGLENCCEIADSAAQMRAEIERLFDQSFTYYAYEARQEKLVRSFSNRRNAAQMIRWIFDREPTYPGSSQQTLTHEG